MANASEIDASVLPISTPQVQSVCLPAALKLTVYAVVVVYDILILHRTRLATEQEFRGLFDDYSLIGYSWGKKLEVFRCNV